MAAALKPQVTGQRAIFLDRDGVINVDPGYVHKPADLHLMPRVAEAIQLLKQAGYLIIVITNQSGIARGMFTFADLAHFHAAMQRALETYSAASRIDRFYICPHFPGGSVTAFARDCDCRKPAAGNIMLAARTFAIDLAHSFMVGDRETDVACGITAATRTVLIGPQARATAAEATCPDLFTAAEYILKHG